MRILLCLFVCVCFSGCANTKPANFAQMAGNLKLGMSKDDVVLLMGKAKKTSVRSRGEQIVEEMFYWSPVSVGYRSIDSEHLAADKVVVILNDGLVSEWGDPNSIDRIMERSADLQKKLLESSKASQ